MKKKFHHPLFLDNLQPTPTPNQYPPIWELVIGAMQDRNTMGTKKYGSPLQPFNGRDMLRDAFEEALDLVVYLAGAIYERDHAGSEELK